MIGTLKSWFTKSHPFQPEGATKWDLAGCSLYKWAATDEEKMAATRRFSLELDRHPDEFVNSAWVSGFIMSALKYGEGYTQEDYLALRRGRK